MKEIGEFVPFGLLFCKRIPNTFLHAALALRSKYKRGEAGLRHIPQDGGTDQIHLS